MTKLKNLFLLFALLAVPAQADIVWTGAVSNDIFDEANWDLSNSTVTLVDPNVSINDDILIANAASPVELTDVLGQGRFQIGNGYTLTVDASVLNTVNNDGVGGAPGASLGPNVIVRNGGSFNTFFITNHTILDIRSGCSATFGGGATPLNASAVNITAGATLAFMDETAAAYISEHLSKTTVDGAPAVVDVNSQVVSDGSQGCIVTVIGLATPFCSGDQGACPCGNDNDGTSSLAGCANGAFSSGGGLAVGGTTSVLAGDLILSSSRTTPGAMGIFFQGNNALGGGAGVPFGDGLRCAGGGVIRLQVTAIDLSGSANTTINVSLRGGILGGETKHYQFWYQDTQATPCGSGFNLTNAVEVVWSL
jgi:hypothetical protein